MVMLLTMVMILNNHSRVRDFIWYFVLKCMTLLWLIYSRLPMSLLLSAVSVTASNLRLAHSGGIEGSIMLYYLKLDDINRKQEKGAILAQNMPWHSCM